MLPGFASASPYLECRDGTGRAQLFRRARTADSSPTLSRPAVRCGAPANPTGCQMTFVDLVVQTRASLHPDGEPEEFIAEHTGFVRAEGDDGAVRSVGKARAYRHLADLGIVVPQRLNEVGHRRAGAWCLTSPSSPSSPCPWSPEAPGSDAGGRSTWPPGTRPGWPGSWRRSAAARAWSRPTARAGLKVTCQGCGQRLQDPSTATPPGRDRMVPGSPLPPR
jgi:hypothetical protein